MLPNTLTMMLESGPVIIKLRHDLAPRHVERVCQLVAEGFYDGAPFGRVTPQFLAQVKLPGRSAYPDLPAEFSDLRHVRGLCLMARGVDPDSANAEFFILTNAAAFTPCQYTIWGEVRYGMELLDALPDGDPPAHPERIVTMRAADWNMGN
ncbi:MAG: peptidylprolyl isomerase [Sphingobium sp.]